MREDYVKLIKEHILSNPDYKYTINELKASLLSYGVTQQEFDQALNELAGPALTPTIEPPKQENKAVPPSQEMKAVKQELDTFSNRIDQLSKQLDQKDNTKSNLGDKIIAPLKQPRSLKKLMVLDVATHVAIIFLILLGGTFFLYWMTFGNSSNNAATTVASKATTNVQSSLVTQVYANGKP